jgi:hypothetical protein
MSATNAPAALMRMVLGFQASQAIHVTAQLGLADLIKDGTKSADELGPQVGANPASLYRLMRAVAALGVFHEDNAKRFSLTEMGECLRSDAKTPVAPAAFYFGLPHYWAAWGDLLHSVKTGESAFKHLYGMSSWDYFQAHPNVGSAFDRVMSGNSRSDAAAAIAAYDFSKFSRIIDIAGGQGVLLSEILVAYPDARGVLFDQPNVIARAAAPSAAGVADRVELVAGDFFKSVPASGDAYLLKLIIHDWDDAKCGTILKKIRNVIDPAGRVIVLERVIEPPNQGDMTKLSDLNMMVSPGGIERTEDEFAAMFAGSGFRLEKIIGTRSRLSVIEASPI